MKAKLVVRRALSFALASVLLMADASAIVKDVYVYGVRSINDAGLSDNRITMDTLVEDYSGYLQSNVLTEYFHKDIKSIPKVDMTEAIAWLIDHNIISRDETITVSNTNRIPSVDIQKSDVASIRYTPVGRSDAVMYMYKAVFGPLDGRAIGVETPNVRSDGGSEDTLARIMMRHDYFTLQSNLGNDYIDQESQQGSGGDGYEYIGQVHIDIGGGANGGSSSQTIYSINDSSSWRYTPQGDKVTSVFGDTNIFISDVEINQDANTSGNSGSHGGGGNVTGNVNQAVDYDTDYKEIFYTPGADVLFYNTSDVLEMYLQALESKGILPSDLAPNTTQYRDVFLPLVEPGAAMASWSGNADPYIVNMNSNTKVRVEKVSYANLRDMLGKNYSVRFSGNRLTINRIGLFDGQHSSGYFEKEELSKMDAFRYAYWMLFANEKKLTSLEVDIVNYKYGLQLSGLSSFDDIEVVKYLIAKGILDYDGGNDLSGLYGSIKWDDFFTLLYRVANPNARLDFSKIQLTDSESSWKAKGFQPLDVTLVSGQAPSITMSDLNTHSDDWEPLPEIEENQVPLVMGPDIGPFVTAYADEPTTEPVTMENSGYQVVKYSGSLQYTYYNGWYLNFVSMWKNSVDATADFKAELDRLNIDDIVSGKVNWGTMSEPHDRGFNTNNPIHVIEWKFTSNLFYCRFMAKSAGKGDTAKQYLRDKIAEVDTALTAAKTANPRRETDVKNLENVKAQLVAAQNNFYNNVTKAESDAYKIFFHKTPYMDMSSLPIANLTSGALTDGLYDIALANSVISSLGFRSLSFGFTGDNNGLGRILISWYDQSYTGSTTTPPDAGVVYRFYTNAEVTAAGGLNKLSSSFANRFEGRASAGAPQKGLQTYSNGADQYVTYDELRTLGTITQWQGNEWILYNSANGVRAIFTNPDNYNLGGTNVEQRATALIGSHVVTTSASTGVAYKDTTGGENKMMYHLEAVRALLGANSEMTVLGTKYTMGVDDVDFSSMAKSYNILSSSGVRNGSVVAISALLGADGSPLESGIDSSSTYYKSTTYSEAGGKSTVWADFLAVTDTSNLVNYVTRRVEFEPGNSTGNATKAVGYMVLSFEVDDELKGAAKKVNGGTMLQDILDAPNQKPSDATAAAIWDKNKTDANLYANIIYQTSGGTYIQTGWLKPRLDFYVCGSASSIGVPASVFNPMSEEDFKSMTQDSHVIGIHDLIAYRHGAVMKVDENDRSLSRSQALSKLHATYWLSGDCKFMISGERLYINRKAIPGLLMQKDTDGKLCYVQASNMTNPASFTVGTKFTVQGDKNSPALQGIVMETTDTGRIKCQMGPVKGNPLILDGKGYIIRAAQMSEKTFSAGDTSKAYVGQGEGTMDEIYGSFLKAFRSTVFSGVEFKGLSTDPLALREPSDKSDKSYMVFNGQNAKMYSAQGRPYVTVPLLPEQAKDKETPTALRSYYQSWNQSNTGRFATASTTHAYYNIEFDGTQYKIMGGELQKGTASATDYLSPELFTSLNNVIIDGMLGKTTGAIPINEVPEGALLQIGNYWYASRGTSTDAKEFVGFARISGNIHTATLQNTSLCYANHNIRAGSQLVNISHFFNQYKILDLVNGTDKNDYQTDLELVKQETMTSGNTNTKLVAVNGRGQSSVIANDDKTYSATYAAVSIKFQNYLLAFEDISEDGGVKRYVILPTAVSETSSESAAVDGAFAGVPFFENSVIDRGIAEYTSDVLASTYQRNFLADQLREALHQDFEKLFAGDLITLARFLLFILVMWLILAAWLCFCARASNLIPILDAIKHPSGDRNQNGIDLMKIVSLGTISLETEFGLGKFLQYNAILCTLLCIIMLTGRITIGGA